MSQQPFFPLCRHVTELLPWWLAPTASVVSDWFPVASSDTAPCTDWPLAPPVTFSVRFLGVTRKASGADGSRVGARPYAALPTGIGRPAWRENRCSRR